MPEPEVTPAATTPAAAHDGRGVWRSWVVFLVVSAAFAALLVAHNQRLFATPIYEDGDSATNSLLIFKAKRLELVHGHYSRLGFYHPGPGLLYVLAGAEWLFHDTLAVVPAPHNAHMLGVLLLYAVLIGVSVTAITRGMNSRLAGAAAAVVFLTYFAREGHLSSHWFAYVFFLPFLTFQVSAASVASGRATHLGWMALMGGLAVHGHVSFVAFVVPISLYAIARLLVKRGFRVWSLPAREQRAWAVFAVVIGLFLLPIALHVALHYPGEVGRYLYYTRQPGHRGGSAAEVSTFLIRTLTHESRLGWPLALGVAAGAVAAAATFPGPGRFFARQLGAVCVASCAAMVYYALRGVDDLHQTYIGIFFGSVLLLAWTLIGMRVAVAFDRGLLSRGLTLTAGAGLAAWAALTGVFTNSYLGSPEAPVIADAICTDPRWEAGPPAISMHPDCWPQAAAVLVQMERRGKHAWLVERSWDVVFTDQFRLSGRPVGELWQIDAAKSSDPTSGVRRVLGEFDGASFREVSTRCSLGQPIPLGQGERPAGAKPVAGWYGTGELDYLLPIYPAAALLVDVPPAAGKEVRLTLTAKAVAPGTPSAGGQRVGVMVNGVRVGEVTFYTIQDEERSLVFAGEVLARGSPARIEFEFPDARGYRTRRHPGLVERYSIQLHGLMLTPVGR